MNYPDELTNTYEIYEKIGEGGGGSVFLARHKRLDKMVVLKRIKTAAMRIQDCRTEVDILKNLRHSNLPQVIDFIESSEGIFTVMDFIPGKSLQKMLDEGHKFSEAEVIEYARQLCEALSYLHSQNPPIIHGDIKPDNIMVTPEGKVCLIDFNISGALDGQGTKVTGYTPGFSSPEQIQAFQIEKEKLIKKREQERMAQQLRQMEGQSSQETVLLDDDKTVLLDASGNISDGAALNLNRTPAAAETVPEKTSFTTGKKKNTEVSVVIDKRSDVFSVGATLYTLLTGKHLNTEKKVSLVIPALSDGLSLVLSKSLEFQAGKRYQDAEEMLTALKNIHKKNKKYRRLILRQELTVLLWVVLLAGSVFSLVEGQRKLKSEREEQYSELVRQMEAGVSDGILSEEFETLFSKAVKLHEDYLDPYYAKALYLYNNDSYEAADAYLETIQTKALTENFATNANLFYLCGDCKFRKEEYEAAKFFFQKALEEGNDSPSLYCDYAISLVYLGQITEAADFLNTKAISKMQEAEVSLVRGEIERLTGNEAAAITCFQTTLKSATDEYALQRAYILASKAYASLGTVEYRREDVNQLSEGVQRLSRDYRLLLQERLIEENIVLGEMTGDKTYYEAAIDVLKKNVEENWANHKTYGNIVVLSQRIGDLLQAEEWAEKMRTAYPQHYTSYLRAAFVELEKQTALPEKERDYGRFVEYFKEAKNRFAKDNTNKTDSELLMLEDTYQQLVDGNWVKE